MHAEQFPQAIETFKKVIQMAPDMAVGYSQSINCLSYEKTNLQILVRYVCNALQTFPEQWHDYTITLRVLTH